jgi:hypothetical protein
MIVGSLGGAQISTTINSSGEARNRQADFWNDDHLAQAHDNECAQLDLAWQPPGIKLQSARIRRPLNSLRAISVLRQWVIAALRFTTRGGRI